MNRLQTFMSNKNIDFSIFFSSANDPNYFYFTGTRAYGILIVPRMKKPFIITNIMEIERVRKSTSLSVLGYEKKEDISRIIEKRLGETKKIGINRYNILLATLDSLKKMFRARFVDVGELCNEIRSIKRKDEIEKISTACKLSDKIFQKLVRNFNFRTELEIANFIEFEAKRQGYEISFPTIVASGENASMPHHEPDGRLKRGFCIIDFGVRYEGYCADMTRTVYIGKPSSKEVKIYYDVLKAQRELINEVKPGIKSRVLYEMMFQKLRPYRDGIIHDLGHGLGIDVHEIPSISSETLLKENMVITIEPGIYFKGEYGIRIEDDILVKSKPAVLTNAKKDLIILSKS